MRMKIFLIILLLVALVLAGVWLFSPEEPIEEGLPSHFSTIGFPLSRVDDLGQLTRRAIGLGQRIDVPGSTGQSYYRYALPEGEEIWVAVDHDQVMEGIRPYFRATNRNPAQLLRRIEDSSSKWRYQAVFQAQVPNADGNGICGELNFHSPNALLHATAPFSQTLTLHLTAFADQVDWFANEQAFVKDQTQNLKFSAESFFPSGLLVQEGALESKSQVLFSGTVQDAKLLRNSDTGARFYWASVKTQCLTLDVVADHRALPTVPVRGNVLGVAGWLVGDWDEPGP